MTRLPPTSVWPVVHGERRALFEDLQVLEPQQWQTPSLCPGWDVHDVLAHLIDSARTTRLGFVRRMVAAGFDFDRDNAVGVAREKRGDPSRTLAEFGAVLPLTSTPPAALATRLVESFVHGEDIRRPLGIDREYPAGEVAKALAYQANTTVKMGGGKEMAAGWRLVAADADFVHGSGPEVTGRAIALLLAVSGRAVDPRELDGPGAGDFVRRLQA